MSKDFPDGVLWYTTGTITYKVHFPENQVCCRWCEFIKAESDMNRHRCRLTNEMIYTLSDIGVQCPIVIDKEQTMNELERLLEESSKDIERPTGDMPY